ncbi:MAG TPA: OmpH family outer membrane protein [Gammaproteobacteria bacterium]|nr:OmpH family outer membrane protein [Gammaproteobacteria bacterium]
MIRKPLFISMLLAAAALGCAVQAQAADIKIGVVDMPSLLQKSPQAQSLSQEMAKKFDSRKKDLMAEQDKIKNQQDQLSKNGAVMSASQLQDAQSQLDELQRDFSRKQSDYMDDVNMERNAALSRLQQEVLKAVQEFAQAQKYNLIVGDGVFYKDNSVDVTDQVLAQMQKDFKAESAAGGN